MNSYISVINAALLKLGVKPIASIEDQVDGARYAKLRYDSIRQRCIAEHTWNFARKRVSLAPLSTAPAFQYRYQFQLPSDLIRIGDPGITDFSVEGLLLLCDDAIIDLIYFADITDPTQWPAYFVEFVVTSLAFELCTALTQSAELRAQLAADLQEAEKKAKFRNAREQAQRVFRSETHLDARRNQHVGEFQ